MNAMKDIIYKIKEYGLFISLYKIIHRVIIKTYSYIIKKISKLDNNSIVFMSLPCFSDNSLAFSEYLLKKNYHNKYKIYWVVDNIDYYKNKYPNSKYIFIQEKNKYNETTFKYTRIGLTSKFLFGTHWFANEKSNSIKGQQYILLWHGCSFKDKNSNNNERKFDIALVAGPIFKKTKSKFWNISEKYLLAKGYPRYNWLINPSQKAYEYKDILTNKYNKLIIWMPTFRNDKNGYYKETEKITNFPLINNNDEWKNLDIICKNNNIKLLIKLHPFQKSYNIKFDLFDNIIEITNEDLKNRDIPLYELVGTTDALITDYSSIAIDYLLINKPIAYTLDDFHLYKDMRGFVFDNPKSYMIGDHLYTINDLNNFINKISCNIDTYESSRNNLSNELIYKSNDYCYELLKELDL